MSGGEIAETVVGCVTGLTLLLVLVGREFVKRGWVRFSLSFAVIPLEKRGRAPAAATAAPKVIPGTVVHETGQAA